MIQTSLLTHKQLVFKIISACLLMFVALIIPALLIQNYPISDNPNYNHVLMAIAIALIVIFGIKFLRSKLDKEASLNMGLNNPKIAIKSFFIGIGLILTPLILTLIISQTFGWVDFNIHLRSPILLALLLGLISTLFTDALSEELIFRGYIYSNLKKHFSIWRSSAITLIAFVVAPILLITIQGYLHVEGSVPLTGGYIINLIFFGAFMQYLRVIFKSIWVGVGFHLIFVHMNQLMGTTTNSLLQFSENSNQQAIQILLISFLLLAFLSLIIYPIVKRKRSNKLTNSAL